jgi:hypothetical protein
MELEDHSSVPVLNLSVDHARFVPLNGVADVGHLFEWNGDLHLLTNVKMVRANLAYRPRSFCSTAQESEGHGNLSGSSNCAVSVSLQGGAAIWRYKFLEGEWQLVNGSGPRNGTFTFERTLTAMVHSDQLWVFVVARHGVRRAGRQTDHEGSDARADRQTIWGPLATGTACATALKTCCGHFMRWLSVEGLTLA